MANTGIQTDQDKKREFDRARINERRIELQESLDKKTDQSKTARATTSGGDIGQGKQNQRGASPDKNTGQRTPQSPQSDPEKKFDPETRLHAPKSANDNVAEQEEGVISGGLNLGTGTTRSGQNQEGIFPSFENTRPPADKKVHSEEQTAMSGGLTIDTKVTQAIDKNRLKNQLDENDQTGTTEEQIKRQLQRNRQAAREQNKTAAITGAALNISRLEGQEQANEPTQEAGEEEEGSAVNEDQMQRQLYQERQAAQQQEMAQQEMQSQQPAEEQEQAEGAGEAQEPSGDNLILFFASLFIAALKDLLDLIGIETFGLFGTLTNIFFSGIFALILLLRGSKLNNSKTLIRYIIAGIAEFIPMVNLLPMWTISVLWEKLEKKLPAGMQVVSQATGGASKQQTPTPTNTQQPPPAQEEESDDDMRMAA